MNRNADRLADQFVDRLANRLRQENVNGIGECFT